MADLVLYDGVCGLCDRLNRFLLDRDRAGRLQFASLQGALAKDLLDAHGRKADDLDTVYVVVDHGGPSEHLLWKGRAIVHVLRSVGGVWRVASVAEFLPDRLVDAVYDFVARRRYRWFGRFDSCPIPPPHYRSRFLDDP